MGSLTKDSTDTDLAVLALDRVTFGYSSDPNSTPVVQDLSISVYPGEFVCLVGPSGAGKTTLLRLMSGLLKPKAGNVIYRGKDLVKPSIDVGVVFQDYSRALCPWRSVVRNVELPLEVRGTPKAQRRDRAVEALSVVGLNGREQDFPRQLSGGMQQRIQLARTIAAEPGVLLMDEPFASLDALTKFQLEDLLLDTWKNLNQTIVMVTHDLDEAVYLADRVIVLTSNPATVSEVVDIHLPRPRDQVHTRSHADFAALRTSIFQRIDQIVSANSTQ